MLKRTMMCLVGLAVAAGTMFSTAAPALANPAYHGKNCQQLFNSQQTRGFQWCISVMQGDDGQVWARTEIWDINGLNDPYYLDETSAGLQSKTTDSGSVCNGRYPGCSGAGDVDQTVIHSLPSSYANALQVNTAHYANAEHLCLNNGDGRFDYKLYQGDPLSYTDASTANPVWWSSYPDCTGY